MDITTRLRDLHDDAAPAPSASVIEADLQRGRRALNHRRMRRTAGAGTAAIAGVGLVTALALSGSGAHTPPVAQRQTHHQHAAPRTAHHGVTAGRIKLVDYTGPQKHGFDVAQVPDGWVLQESSPGFLTIAPAGDHSDGSTFINKLVVMLRSTDDTGPMRGTPVTVNGRHGAIAEAQGVKTLTFTDGVHQVQVQAWSNVGWTDDQLVAFAQGVTVTANVAQSHG